MPPTTIARRTHDRAEQSRRSSRRIARTSISRPTNYYAKPFGNSGRNNADTTPDEAPPGFFPAIEHFTDVVASLPREVMRHLTVLKEFEAKVWPNTEELKEIELSIKSLPPPARRAVQPSNSALLSLALNNGSTNTSANNSVVDGGIQAYTADTDETTNQPTTSFEYTESDVRRRKEYARLRVAHTSIISELDEKHACLVDANRALSKLLMRMDHVIPYVESEISEDVRLGSLNHWAYADNKTQPTATQQTVERSRNVAVTNSLTAAAAAIREGEVAAARNEGRKETTKKRGLQVDGEAEDKISAKKPQLKGRKGDDGEDQGAKKRKVDKGVGTVAMERTLSSNKQIKTAAGAAGRSAVGNDGNKRKPKPPSAPLAKAKGVATASPARSPLPVASPTITSFKNGVDQPIVRPSSRMRQGSAAIRQERERSIQPANRRVNANKQRAGSQTPSNTRVDDIHSNANLVPPLEREGKDSVSGTEAASIIEESLVDNGRATRSTGARPNDGGKRPADTGKSRQPSSNHILKQLASYNRSPLLERQDLPGSLSVDPQDEQNRDLEMDRGAQNNVRSSITPDVGEVEALGIEYSEDEQGKEGAPRYCTCKGEAFGTMIACENDNCPIEWFHLGCLGLKRMPKVDEKWFCEDCITTMNPDTLTTEMKSEIIA